MCVKLYRSKPPLEKLFFMDKVIAHSRRSEVTHGRYKRTDVCMFLCLLLQAKLIVLFITYSVSGSVLPKYGLALFFLEPWHLRNLYFHIRRIFRFHTVKIYC